MANKRISKKKRKETAVWITDGVEFRLREKRKEIFPLNNWVYKLCVDSHTGERYLEKLCDNFTFDYKIYELEEGIINRFSKTYRETNGNIGILLNGLKGTGKTVTSKLLCNALEQPVIVVPERGSETWLNDIPQNITIFVDEYEKIYGNDSSMLTIMDGVLNADYRRLFLFTTNRPEINENMIQRPARIRYIRTFSDLKTATIKLILNDCLIHEELYEESLKFISSLEMITVDIVKSIITEINIHKESPFKFADIFNVKQIAGKYDVYMQVGETEMLIKRSVKVNPRQSYWVDEDNIINDAFYVDDRYLGRISQRLSDFSVKVKMDVSKDAHIFKLAKVESLIGKPVIKKKTNNNDDDDDDNGPVKEVIFTVERSFMTHTSFKNDDKLATTI